MKLLTSLLYLFKRRRSGRADFDRLYRLSADPFGIESYPYEQKKIQRVVDQIATQRFNHILDIGCGTGSLSRRIAPFADTVTAIDYSPQAITRAAQYDNPSNIRYTCVNLVTFSYETYDLILCSEVLYYLPTLDLLSFVEIVKQQAGCTLISIGKIGEPVDEILETHFALIERIEETANRRPYAISIYRVK